MGNGDPPWVIPGEFAGNKQVVIKSSGAIHISNDITLLQRRAWNVLLAHAYDELPIKEEHSIKISKLVNILNYESTNIKYLKETLKALVDTKVEWNLLGRDGKEVWGVAALLAQVELEGHRGTCTYAYAPAIRKRLYNPAIYAKVNLWLQNKFSSKHTLALYECCVDWYNVNSKCGETPWIPIPVLRKCRSTAWLVLRFRVPRLVLCRDRRHLGWTGNTETEDLRSKTLNLARKQVACGDQHP